MKKASSVLGFIIKLLVIIAVVGIVLYVYQTCAGSPIIQKIDKYLPSISEAPFEVPTRTHTYYCRKGVQNPDGSVTMTGWYEKIDKKWQYHAEATTIPKLLKPRIERRER